MNQQELEQFCQKLPKVELHAHLNTSYSYDSLHELIALSGDTWEHVMEELHISVDSHIDESFKFFTKIQKLVKTEEAVYLLTHRVITEFANENVKYLELRSTPKEIPETKMTRELYMRTMIRAAKDCEKEGLDIMVRFLVSIDRRHGVEVAKLTVDLAEKLKNESGSNVIGIDFSGDPKVGDATDFIPVFRHAAQCGLKLALHLAELPQFEETKNVLKALSSTCDIRIGHGTFLHRYDQGKKHEEIEELVAERKIPIEACMTSNLRTMTVSRLEEHHFKYWLDKGHPVVLCTDGKGVYASTLSQEYAKAATTYNLSEKELKEIAISAIDSIFETEEVKKMLRDKFLRCTVAE